MHSLPNGYQKKTVYIYIKMFLNKWRIVDKEIVNCAKFKDFFVNLFLQIKKSLVYF